MAGRKKSPRKGEIAPGDRAPAFRLPAAGGGLVSLADFRGKTVVLYFYPKDDTPGCTREALDFSAAAERFRKAGAVVIGVSKDPPARHEKFRDKHGLSVVLLSDEPGDTIAAYGAWVEKSLYGRNFMGTDRSTFLIDGRGVVRRVWRKVRVGGHVDEVLRAAQDLRA
jgi:peroxiredoxin Q/BCP